MNVFETTETILRSTELSSNAKIVAVRLAHYQGQNGRAWPYVAQLANECGMKKLTCQRALAELQAKGWLIRHFPKRQNVTREATQYRLTGKATGEIRGIKSETPRGIKSDTVESPKKNPKKSETTARKHRRNDGGKRNFEKTAGATHDLHERPTRIAPATWTEIVETHRRLNGRNPTPDDWSQFVRWSRLNMTPRTTATWETYCRQSAENRRRGIAA